MSSQLRICGRRNGIEFVNPVFNREEKSEDYSGHPQWLDVVKKTYGEYKYACVMDWINDSKFGVNNQGELNHGKVYDRSPITLLSAVKSSFDLTQGADMITTCRDNTRIECSLRGSTRNGYLQKNITDTDADVYLAVTRMVNVVHGDLCLESVYISKSTAEVPGFHKLTHLPAENTIVVRYMPLSECGRFISNIAFYHKKTSIPLDWELIGKLGPLFLGVKRELNDIIYTGNDEFRQL